jgi:hypothetical protein
VIDKNSRSVHQDAANDLRTAALNCSKNISKISTSFFPPNETKSGCRLPPQSVALINATGNVTKATDGRLIRLQPPQIKKNKIWNFFCSRPAAVVAVCNRNNLNLMIGVWSLPPSGRSDDFLEIKADLPLFLFLAEFAYFQFYAN